MIYYEEHSCGLYVSIQTDVTNQDGLRVLKHSRTTPILVGFVGDQQEVEDVKILIEHMRKKMGLSPDRRIGDRRKQQNGGKCDPFSTVERRSFYRNRRDSN